MAAVGYNPDTKAIEISAGDTRTIKIALKDENANYDAVVFAVYDKTNDVDLLRIPAQISEGKAVIRLANKHTRDLDAGKYKWQLRFVSNPETDEYGNIIANDDDDNVMSAFGPGYKKLPDFTITRDGAYV